MSLNDCDLPLRSSDIFYYFVFFRHFHEKIIPDYLLLTNQGKTSCWFLISSKDFNHDVGF